MNFSSKLFFVFTALALAACGQDTGYGGAGTGAGGTATCNPCRIFSTTTTVKGNFGGAAAADAVCNNDASRPNSSNYKAILWSSTRSPSNDWALTSGVAYVQADGTTPIGTADSSGFIPPPLTNPLLGTSSVYHWTGVDIAGAPVMAQSASSCSGWTDNTNSVQGASAGSNLKASYTYVGQNTVGRACDSDHHFYCAEQ